jgi:hypothetical protein
MSSNPSGDVTTVAIEMEPGWVYFKMADPKPSPDRISFFLDRTVEDWFAKRPTFIIDRATGITEQGEIVGIHVWYRQRSDSPDELHSGAGVATDTLPFEVHGLIAQSFSKEYVEAVVEDVMKILPAHKHREDTLVAINPRRVAVILDKKAHKGAVIPVEFIEQVIQGPMKSKLHTWLATPATPYYVMHIAGSWFSTTD